MNTATKRGRATPDQLTNIDALRQSHTMYVLDPQYRRSYALSHPFFSPSSILISHATRWSLENETLYRPAQQTQGRLISGGAFGPLHHTLRWTRHHNHKRETMGGPLEIMLPAIRGKMPRGISREGKYGRTFSDSDRRAEKDR